MGSLHRLTDRKRTALRRLPAATPGRCELGRVVGRVGLGAIGDPDTEQWARDTMVEAFEEHYGRPGTIEEIQALQALGRHEGQYGRGWIDHPNPHSGIQTSMAGSNNWGAVMCTNKPVNGDCGPGCGYWHDSRPTASGQVGFEACFKRYATPKDGAIGILEVFDRMPSVIEALPTGDLDEIAYQMRLNRYFLGFKVDPWEASQEYAAALDKAAESTSNALGEERFAYRKGGADANPDGYATSENPEGGEEPSMVVPVLKAIAALALAIGGAVAVGKGVKRWRKGLGSSAKRSSLTCGG